MWKETACSRGGLKPEVARAIAACFARHMAKPKSSGDSSLPAQDRISLRIDLATGGRIGPGKVAVLEAIARTGSISGAGRDLGMSYRRTWGLVEDLNRSLGRALVETAAGGSGGGGAQLTAAGHAVVACYRAIEADSLAVARTHLAILAKDHG